MYNRHTGNVDPPVIKPNAPMRRRQMRRLPENSTIGFTKKQKTVQRLMNIDSRNRDLNAYSNSNEFKFTLQRPLKNVTKLELVTAEIPNTEYLVDNTNNKIDLTDNGNAETITLTEGDYDADSLATELATRLNALTNGTIFTVTFSDATGKYTIGGDQNFSLLFSTGANADSIATSTDGRQVGYLQRGNSARRLLGFNIEDTTSGTSVTSTNKIMLIKHPYVVLELGPDVYENLDYFDDRSTSAFGKILLDDDNLVTKYKESDYEIARTYDPPLKKLEFLYVKWRSYGGNLYDFEGHENSFLLRVHTLE